MKLKTLALAAALFALAACDNKAQTSVPAGNAPAASAASEARSEEHTSELQSPRNLVCRLLLEKKKTSNKV